LTAIKNEYNHQQKQKGNVVLQVSIKKNFWIKTTSIPKCYGMCLFSQTTSSKIWWWWQWWLWWQTWRITWTKTLPPVSRRSSSSYIRL